MKILTQRNETEFIKDIEDKQTKYEKPLKEISKANVTENEREVHRMQVADIVYTIYILNQLGIFLDHFNTQVIHPVIHAIFHIPYAPLVVSLNIVINSIFQTRVESQAGYLVFPDTFAHKYPSPVRPINE